MDYKGGYFMSNEVFVEFIKIIPNLLRLLIYVALILIFYKPIKHHLIPRLSGFKFLGVEATFLSDELDKAVSKCGEEVPKNSINIVIQRAQKVMFLLRRVKILWVDDNQLNNISEHKILRSFGCSLDIVNTTSEALKLAKKNNYIAIISDMKRDGSSTEGLKMLSIMRSENILAPIVFYFPQFDQQKGIPPYAFGATNRADILLHYIIDIVERELY